MGGRMGNCECLLPRTNSGDDQVRLLSRDLERYPMLTLSHGLGYMP